MHSLDVAKLALFISKQRNYDEEVQDHLVVAALLHDIGHAPLSHSMEPSFFDEFGINHHVAGNRVIKEKEFSLKKILEDQVSIDTVIDLVEQNSEEEFSDIFNSKINIDTIDGIQKAYRLLMLT
nr:HD domain-containing protein [Vibrio taketomensis]